MITAINVREVDVGQVISAQGYNALVRTVLALVDAVNSGGVGGAVGAGGAGDPTLGPRPLALGPSGPTGPFSLDRRSLALALLTNDQRRFAEARVVGKTVGDGPEWPSDVLYTVRLIDGGAEIVNVRPAFGRPVRGDEAKIYSAPIGSPCWVIRMPGGDGAPFAGGVVLLPDAETVYRQPCPTGTAQGLLAAPGAMTRQRTEEIERRVVAAQTGVPAGFSVSDPGTSFAGSSGGDGGGGGGGGGGIVGGGGGQVSTPGGGPGGGIIGGGGGNPNA